MAVAKMAAVNKSFNEPEETRNMEKGKVEILNVSDAAEAFINLLQNYTGEMHVNVGAGYDISATELAAVIADIGRLKFDVTQNAGVNSPGPRKLLNIRRLAATGWQPRTGLREGIAETWGAMATGRR